MRMADPTTAPWTLSARLDSSLFLVGFLRDALLAAGGNLGCGEVQVVGGHTIYKRRTTISVTKVQVQLSGIASVNSGRRRT